jgi:hypothetical protein
MINNTAQPIIAIPFNPIIIRCFGEKPSARIINVTSEMHKRGGKPDFNDFQLPCTPFICLISRFLLHKNTPGDKQ